MTCLMQFLLLHGMYRYVVRSYYQLAHYKKEQKVNPITTKEYRYYVSLVRILPKI